MNLVPLPYAKYTFLNKKYLNTSTECGCIYCFNRFHPSTVNEFCYGRDAETNDLVLETIICPVCSVDSVVPNRLIDYTDEMLFEWHIAGWGLESAIKRQKKK